MDIVTSYSVHCVLLQTVQQDTLVIDSLLQQMVCVTGFTAIQALLIAATKRDAVCCESVRTHRLGGGKLLVVRRSKRPSVVATSAQVS